MHLQRRFIRPADIDAVAGMIGSDDGHRDRYGSALEILPGIWKDLLREDRLNATVIEDLDHSSGCPVAVGATVFVTDDFLRSCKSTPMRWMGPELLRQMQSGAEPILTRKAMLAANSADGLNLAIWVACTRPSPSPDCDNIHSAVIEAYLRGHAGFQLKEIVAQPIDIARALLLIKSGMLLWDEQLQRYASSAETSRHPARDQPFLIGITRELAAQNMWTSHQFNWVPPRIGLTASEQRLLKAALGGLTDGELSRELRVSLSTVKHRWRDIFVRVAQQLPSLLPERKGSAAVIRGKEKRGRLLAYILQHPEELRPYRKVAAPN